MTRQELYDLVWSVPMRSAAKQLGISDKSVAKRCETHNIPTPPRGHWTRVDANRAGPRLPLEGDISAEVVMVHDRVATRSSRIGAQSDEGQSHCAQIPAPSSSTPPVAVPPIGVPTLRALAVEVQSYSAMLALIDSVAGHAMSLPTKSAAPLLAWAAQARDELDRTNPVARLADLLLQRC